MAAFFYAFIVQKNVFTTIALFCAKKQHNK